MNNQQREAMQIALDWFNWLYAGGIAQAPCHGTKAQAALREALAQDNSIEANTIDCAAAIRARGE